MAHFYLDSSALVKRYVIEKGTPWIQTLTAPTSEHTIFTVRISGAEIVAAFFLRVRTGAVSLADVQPVVVQFKTDFQALYQIVEVTEAGVNSAMLLAEKHSLRGYDAIQLSSVLALHNARTSLSLSPITFVCADNHLNKAASAAGIHAIINPNDRG